MGCIKRTKPHQAMYAVLAFELAIGKATSYLQRGTFDTSFFTGGFINHFNAIVMLFRPPYVHTHEHFCPILCVGSTRSSINTNYSLVIIIGAGKFKLFFEIV